MNDSELSILNTSAKQLTHFITAAHQTRNANLVGAKVVMLAAEPVPAGTPSSTDLNDILNNAVKTPSTTSIATVPETPDTAMYQMLSQVQTLDSYISLLSSLCIYNEHRDPYDITDPKQASQFTRAMAKWRNYVITGGGVKAMAGYLPVTSIADQSFSKTVVSADLHAELFTALFGAFALPEAAMTELESILTNVVGNIKELKLSFESQTDTLDHFLTYYYFAAVEGTGGEGQPPAMYVCKVRTFYLHISEASMKVAVGKSSVKGFQFNMNYYDMDTTMNSGLVSTDMTAINDAIGTFTGKSKEELNTLMNMQAIHADPQNP